MLKTRAGDQGNEQPAANRISRQVCWDRGCIDWRDGVDRDICSIINPEHGALTGVHKRIDVVIWKFIGAITILISGIFAFVTWTTNDMKVVSHETNLAQDVVIKQIIIDRELLSAKVDKIYELLLAHNEKNVMLKEKPQTVRPYRSEQVDKVTKGTK